MQGDTSADKITDSEILFEKEFKREISKSLLLDSKEKSYWIENFKVLPAVVIQGVFTAVKTKNDLINKYLLEALKEDTDHIYLSELKVKINLIRGGLNNLVETKEATAAEEFLNKFLQ